MDKNTNHWQELRLPATPETLPFLETILAQLGAVAISLTDAKDQPLLEPPPGATPLWRDITIHALFQKHTATKDITDQLIAWLPRSLSNTIEWHTIPEENWIQKWNQALQPFAITERLWICPQHHPIPEQAELPIVLDPGLAFGSGKHPTTALCLSWLDQHLTPGMTCLDYGCGSGILAIAALKLGAKQVIAVDNDPQALHASKENAKQNHIDLQRMPTFSPKSLASMKDIQGDCLIANIVANVLIEHQHCFSQLLKPGGQLVLSGILSHQKQIIKEAFSAQFNLEATKQQQGWLLMSFSKRNSDSSS